MNILIAGGGLVGLTAAASLQAAGHEVTVLEQAPAIRAVGAGIGLWSNALREFDRIGLGQQVRDLGREISTWFFDPTGRPVRAAGYAESDHRFLLVPRPALNTLLADAIGHDRIRLAARVESYAEGEHGVTVTLTDGLTVRGDLLLGADGVHSRVRARMLPDSTARPHEGHVAWRAIVPAGGERPEGTVLTIGRDRTRGGYARVAEGRTMWMINQFDAGEDARGGARGGAGGLVGSKRDRALVRARNLAEAGWHDDLLRMIAETPEDAILENQIMLVPPLPRWTSPHVALIGDAAHGLSPHIAAGGTLGIEDVGVLRTALASAADLSEALGRYESARMARFDEVRTFADDVERAGDADEFARAYAAFSHWMLTTAPTDTYRPAGR